MYPKIQMLIGQKFDSAFTCTGIKSLHVADNECSRAGDSLRTLPSPVSLQPGDVWEKS